MTSVLCLGAQTLRHCINYWFLHFSSMLFSLSNIPKYLAVVTLKSLRHHLSYWMHGDATTVQRFIYSLRSSRAFFDYVARVHPAWHWTLAPRQRVRIEWVRWRHVVGKCLLPELLYMTVKHCMAQSRYLGATMPFFAPSHTRFGSVHVAWNVVAAFCYFYSVW